jgi:hypothetical protein
MRTYFVSSGKFQMQVEEDTAYAAAVKAFRNLKKKVPLAYIIQVSKTGFDSNNEDDFWVDTLTVLEEADQIQNYDWFT